MKGVIVIFIVVELLFAVVQVHGGHMKIHFPDMSLDESSEFEIESYGTKYIIPGSPGPIPNSIPLSTSSRTESSFEASGSTTTQEVSVSSGQSTNSEAPTKTTTVDEAVTSESTKSIPSNPLIFEEPVVATISTKTTSGSDATGFATTTASESTTTSSLNPSSTTTTESTTTSSLKPSSTTTTTTTSESTTTSSLKPSSTTTTESTRTTTNFAKPSSTTTTESTTTSSLKPSTTTTTTTTSESTTTSLSESSEHSSTTSERTTSPSVPIETTTTSKKVSESTTTSPLPSTIKLSTLSTIESSSPRLDRGPIYFTYDDEQPSPQPVFGTRTRSDFRHRGYGSPHWHSHNPHNNWSRSRQHNDRWSGRNTNTEEPPNTSGVGLIDPRSINFVDEINPVDATKCECKPCPNPYAFDRQFDEPFENHYGNRRRMHHFHHSPHLY